MDTAIIVAFVAVIISCLSSVVDFLQTWHIKKVQKGLDSAVELWKQNGTFGQQINSYLLASEGEGKPTNLDVISSKFGQAFYSSLRGASSAEKSVEKRRQNMIDNQIVEGAENLNPEIKMGIKLLEQLGFDVPNLSAEEVSYALGKLRKTGFGLPNIGGGSNQESKPGW